MLRLRNRLLPLLRAASSLPSPIHPCACRLLFTSTGDAPAPFSLEDYLIASCGLAPAQAREVSKKASRKLSRELRRPSDEIASSFINSTSNANAILELLSGTGLSRADITAAVSADPLLLSAPVKNIGPRLLALRDRVGLSIPQIASFLLVGSRTLREGDVVPKLEFFISFFGSSELVLVAEKRSNGGLLSSSLEREIKPNIALFHQCGVRDIAKVCLHCPRVLTFKHECVKEILLRAQELGVPAASPLFKEAVATVTRVSRKEVTAKFEFFKRTLGWCESEVSIAVSKRPQILGLSDAILRPKIEFLVNEAAMEPHHIAQSSALLSLSLEKRLVPRYHVMKVLQEKGLLNSKMNLFSLVNLREEAFKLKFINCHKYFVFGLADAYAAVCASIVPSRV